MKNNIKAVIMAGGKGTRISSINSEVPKPMIELLGKPILQYEIEVLVKQGVKDIILVIGYLGEKIKGYFKDGKQLGANISYIVEDSPLGTAGALYYLKDKINDDFLLLNGDTLFDINIEKFYESHKKNNCLVTIVTHPNSHPYDSGVIVADKNNLVIKWMTKEEERTWYKNRVNAGIHFISNKLLSRFSEAKKTDLDREVLKPLINEKQLYVYDTPEYIMDMGTPDRYYQVIEDIKNKVPEKRNLSNKQKAIFLDRDGTINKYVGFLKDINQFELLEGVSDAIKLIHQNNYLVVVVTNQPVVARGEVTFDQLEEIHNKMETLLGKDGTYLDGIYFCPHHKDKGFDGEVKELKFDCPCRKPKPGMILQASKDFNINLNKSWIVGDSDTDIICGNNAKIKTCLINSIDTNTNPDFITKSGLLDGVKKIFEKE